MPIQGNASVGRALGNTLVLNDPRVSRRHAVIHSQGGSEFWLVDLGSSNGTYVNGHRVTQSLALSDGDRLEFGPFIVTFRVLGAKDPIQGSEESEQKTLLDMRVSPAWLAVADIEGSTQLAQELTPGDLAVLTGRWFSQCREWIQQSGGVINKYLGDGFLACWLGESERRQSILTTAQRFQARQGEGAPRFRWVLHHGPVYRGGLDTPGEESLWGDAVNYVFRMEKLAGSLHEPNLLSEVAAGQLALPGMLRSVGCHVLPGFRGEHPFSALGSAQK